MLSKASKEKKIARFSEWVDGAEAILIAENAGLTVQNMEALRKKVRADGGNAQVIKNTLAKRVLSGGRFDSLAHNLSGPLIYGVGNDPAKIAKVFVDAARENPKFIVRAGGMPDKSVMDVAEITALAKLPPREVLLAKLLGTMQAPVAKFVQTLHAVPSGFARALAAVRDQKSENQ
ncbi:MAG: 50S ribosomal protein L10 [Proteobacteria bacterium]|nr:50S ribosomal protein L10 [Pseudomonadota bacterium]